MEELINDVINDLADGHIDKTEAKQRVARIVRTCEKHEYKWMSPPVPDLLPYRVGDSPPWPERTDTPYLRVSDFGTGGW